MNRNRATKRAKIIAGSCWQTKHRLKIAETWPDKINTKNKNRRSQGVLAHLPLFCVLYDHRIFHTAIVAETESDPEQFMKSGTYLYLRSGLIERWDTLSKFGTYPNMIKTLEIG